MATLATIRQAVRDEINEAHGGFFTDTKLNRLINRCYLKVAEEIAKRCNFYLTKQTLTTIAGTYLYALTRPLISTDRITVLDSNGNKLHRIGMDKLLLTSDDTATIATCYDISGNSVALLPIPDASGALYYAWYHAIPAELSADSSTVSLPFGQIAEDYLIAMTVHKCKYIEGDGDMLTYTKADLRDCRNLLMSTIDRTEPIAIDTGDHRVELGE